jgi:AP2 domain.
MKEIQLTRGMVAVVEKEDFDWLSIFSWCYSPVGYAQSRINGKAEYMHRLIMGAKKGEFIDHINLNKLDNRRSNLRFCTRQQNQHNQAARRGTSRYKGVSYRRDTRKYSAQIHVNRKKINLGCFESEEDAARAYNKAALKYHGIFAYLNEVS